MNIWLNFLIDSLAFGATFMYGSTGEILTEKAGHLNLGIPGIMCMGGAGGCLVLNMIGKSGLPPFLIVILGILGSLLLAMFCGLIYSFLTVSLRANQNVTGLALTTFGVGLMKVIMSKLDATVYLIGPKMMYRWPFAGRQDSLQCLGVLFFLAIIIALLASWVLFRTRVGLHNGGRGGHQRDPLQVPGHLHRQRNCRIGRILLHHRLYGFPGSLPEPGSLRLAEHRAGHFRAG